jgi:hypothetical protein
MSLSIAGKAEPSSWKAAKPCVSVIRAKDEAQPQINLSIAGKASLSARKAASRSIYYREKLSTIWIAVHHKGTEDTKATEKKIYTS